MRTPTTLLAAVVLAACRAPEPQPVPPPGPPAAIPVEPPPAPHATAAAAPAEPPEPARPEPAEAPFRVATSANGRFTLEWRPLDRPDVPKNEHFQLEVRLYRGEGTERPMPGARLNVSGWMPDHGHGMVRRPRAVDLGNGRYRVDGMLFQMGGYWKLFFDVIDENIVAERAEFELHL